MIKASSVILPHGLERASAHYTCHEGLTDTKR